jgi:hypothetical protein
MEPVHGFGGRIIEQGVQAIDHEVQFEGAEPLQVPGGVEELVKRQRFQDTLGG